MTQPAEQQAKNEPMELEKKGTLADLLKQLSSLWYGIVHQGPWVSFFRAGRIFYAFPYRCTNSTPQ